MRLLSYLIVVTILQNNLDLWVLEIGSAIPTWRTHPLHVISVLVVYLLCCYR